MFTLGPPFWGASEAAPSVLPLTFDFSGYGISGSPPGDMEWVQIPAELISDYTALGLTVPTLPDYFGDLASKLTNESGEGTGPSSFYWAPINEAVSGARLIYYKFVSAGTVTVEFPIDPALGATTIDVLTTASGDSVQLKASYSNSTDSTPHTYADSPVNAEGTITFTAPSGFVINKLSLVFLAGSDAGASISRIILDN